MSVVYVLTTPMPEDGGENPTVEQNVTTSKELKIPWKPNIWLRMPQDFKLTLKHLKEDLTLIELGSHLRIKVSLRVQVSDKPKGNNVVVPLVVNMVEYNNSSRYNDNKGKRKHHDTRANPNKKLKVTFWKYGKPRHLKKDWKAGNVDGFSWWVNYGETMYACKDRCWFKTYESLNDRSILHMGNESTALAYGRGCVDLRLNTVSDNIGSAFMSTSKLNDSILWHARLGHVHFKRMQDMSNDSDLCDLHATPSLGNKNYFVTLIDDASRVFYVYLLHSKDKALDKFNVFKTKVELQQESLIKRFRTDRGCEYMDTILWWFMVSERVTDEIVQQSKLELKKSKRHKTPKDFRPEFQLYLIKGTRDENEAINDEMDSIIGNNTWVLTDIPPGYKPLGCKWIFKRELKVDKTVEKFKMDVKTAFLNEELEEEVYMNQPLGFIMPGNENKVDLTKEFLSSRFSIKDMGEVDVILGIKIKHESNVSTPLDTYEKLMPYRGLAVSQLKYSRVIGCLMYAMTYTRPDIVFAMGKLCRYTSNLGTQHCQAIQRVLNNTEDNSSTSSWGFLLGGGAIFWAFKTQTCITSSTIESEFVALVATGKEAEWLKNLLFKIPMWVKPITPISICCDSAATLAKAFSQMYNGKYRHLGVRHSMIRELIMNGVRAKAYVLQIIIRMCLEPAGKEDEVANFLMVNFFEKTSRNIRYVEDFKEYTLRDYYGWLKTYNCWYKLKLLDNAAGRKLRLPEESAAANEKMKR
nr:hypothetical protein [Tanacetum cinerariifolium]